jgi:hypothetical protein
MRQPSIDFRPLEGEPTKLRQRPFAMSLLYGAVRLAGMGVLSLVRLAVTSVLALAIAAGLMIVGLHFVGGRVPAIGDANDYLSSVLQVSAGELENQAQVQTVEDYFSETSSAAVVPETPSPGSTASLVSLLSQFAPSTLREVYQQTVPMLQNYDAFLGDVQSALQNNNDLDAFFAEVQPWLQQAQGESQNP